MVFVVFGFQDLSQINGQAKAGGTSMSPVYSTAPLSYPFLLSAQLELNCLGFLFVFALKIGATYARLFLASRVESLFWIFSFLFFCVLFFIFFVLRFLCIFCIFFTSCLLPFLCFCCSPLFFLLLFAMNHAPVVRQFELTL